MRFEDVEITSIGDLVARLRNNTKASDTVWFRGQSDKSWDLIPSLSRSIDLLDGEMRLMKRFIQLAIPQMTDRVPASSDEWDWVFLMQHHGMPTRLLDWSESPLAALWFAVQSLKHNDKAGAVWCLDPLALNAEARLRGRWLAELPAFGRDNILDSYLPERQKDGAGAVPVAAIASRHFRRIVAQQGNFTVSHSMSDPVNHVGKQTHIWRIIVSPEAKPKIREELLFLRFDELLLFPDLDRAAATAMRSAR